MVSVQVARNNPGTDDREVSSPGGESRTQYLCRVVDKVITAATGENFFLNPSSESLFPGAVLDGATVQTGGFAPLLDPRGPITLSIDVETANLPGSTQVSNPAYSTVRDAVFDLRNRAANARIPAMLSSKAFEVFSDDHLNVKAGISFKTGAYNVDGSFEFGSTSTTNKACKIFWQQYYSIIMDPIPANKFFTNNRSILPEDVYVSSVRYGRFMMVVAESVASGTFLSAALDASYAAVADVNLQMKYEATLRRSKTMILVAGGSALDGAHLINNGIPGISAWIDAGANFQATALGIPISYGLRFISDSQFVTVLLGTSYKAHNCVLASGRFGFKNMTLRVTAVGDDPGNELEIYGVIFVELWEKPPVNPPNIFGGGDQPRHSQILFNRSSSDAASLAEGDALTMDDTVWDIPDFLTIKNTGYLRLVASLFDQDDTSGNDFLGAHDYRLNLAEAAPDPNWQSTTDPEGNPKSDTLFFIDGNQKVELGFVVGAVM